MTELAVRFLRPGDHITYDSLDLRVTRVAFTATDTATITATTLPGNRERLLHLSLDELVRVRE